MGVMHTEGWAPDLHPQCPCLPAPFLTTLLKILPCPMTFQPLACQFFTALITSDLQMPLCLGSILLPSQAVSLRAEADVCPAWSPQLRTMLGPEAELRKHLLKGQPSPVNVYPLLWVLLLFLVICFVMKPRQVCRDEVGYFMKTSN